MNIQIQQFSGDLTTVTFFFEQLRDIRTIYKLSQQETLTLFKSKLAGPALHFFFG